MELKLCKWQGKINNSDFIFSPQTVLAHLCLEAGVWLWGVSVMVHLEHIEKGLLGWIEIWQRYVLDSAPSSCFPSQNGFSGRFAATLFLCITDTIVLYDVSLACHAAGKEELEWHSGPCMHRFISCWDADPAPGPYWSLAISHLAQAGVMLGLVGKCILFQRRQVDWFCRLYGSFGLSSKCSVFQKQRFAGWHFL